MPTELTELISIAPVKTVAHSSQLNTEQSGLGKPITTEKVTI